MSPSKGAKPTGNSRKANKSSRQTTSPKEKVETSTPLKGSLPASTISTTSFPIIGVGASAGGLEAFSQLLGYLPEDSDIALVLVQHLDPTYKSMLVEILGKTSNMPVVEVSEGMKVRPRHVYVIPPNTSMTISGGELHLTRRSDATQRHAPIDDFLISLAKEEGSKSIGVILSGTSLDGIRGLRAIKEAGGITFAEDEASAKYYDLPRSAVQAGVVDIILPPPEIASELVRLSKHPYAPMTDGRNMEQFLPQDHLGKIFAVLRYVTGVDFTNYKQATIRRRILRRMTVLKMENLENYVRYLQVNPGEAEALFQEILIHVTGFFREPETFETLKTDVFPDLLKNRSPDDPIRIWVPGCSTGEEVYSVAMCITEALDLSPIKPNVQIFGTDINDNVLRKAREGIYADISDVSPGRQRRFFTRQNGSFQVTKQIRNMVIFAKHNVTADPPFSRMDLILCRNLMIYLGPGLQRKLLPILHYALKPAGFLVLGNFETIGGFTSLFKPLDRKNKVYGKRIVPGPLPADFFTGSGVPELERAASRLGGLKTNGGSMVPQPTELDVTKEADRLLLTRFAPASVVINGDMEIIQFRGRTGLYLEPSPGKASLNVLKMAREGLMMDLRNSVRKAKDTQSPVRREGIRIRTDGRYKLVNLEVTRSRPPDAT